MLSDWSWPCLWLRPRCLRWEAQGDQQDQRRVRWVGSGVIGFANEDIGLSISCKWWVFHDSWGHKGSTLDLPLKHMEDRHLLSWFAWPWMDLPRFPWFPEIAVQVVLQLVKDHKLREEAKQVVGDAEWGKDGNWGWAWNICFIFLENHELLIPADTYRMYLYYDSMYIYIYIYIYT